METDYTTLHLLLAEKAQRQKEYLRQMVQKAAETRTITPEAVEAYAAIHLTDSENGMPITAARHHKLWLEFLCDESIKRLMIIAPFESAKTTWTILGYVGLYVGVFPERSVVIGCNGSDTAQKRSMALRSGVTSSDFQKTFPDLKPDPQLQWTMDTWTLTRIGNPIPNRVHPTLAAYGAGGQVIGSRADLIVADDLLDFKNTRTTHQRREIEHWLYSTLISRARANTGRIIAIGTSWNVDDYYMKAKNEGGWVVVHMPQLSETDELYATITYPDNYKGRTLGTPASRM